MRVAICAAALGLLDAGLAQEQAVAQPKSPLTLIELLSQQDVLAYRWEDSRGYAFRLLSDEQIRQSREYFATLDENVRKQKLLQKRRSELREKEQTRLLDELPDDQRRRIAGARAFPAEFFERAEGRIPAEVLERARAQGGLRLGAGGFRSAMIRDPAIRDKLEAFENEDPQMVELKQMLEKVSPPIKRHTIAEVTRQGCRLHWPQGSGNGTGGPAPPAPNRPHRGAALKPIRIRNPLASQDDLSAVAHRDRDDRKVPETKPTSPQDDASELRQLPDVPRRCHSTPKCPATGRIKRAPSQRPTPVSSPCVERRSGR